MVFNITKDDIRVRMSAVDRDVWPLPATREKHSDPDMLKLIPLVTGPSRQTVLNMPEVVGPIYKEINDRYGTHHEPITDSPLFKTINAAMQLKHKVSERAAALATGSSEEVLSESDLDVSTTEGASLKYLRLALILVGVVFLTGIYPLMEIWPSGWTWHTDHSDYPLTIVGIYATLGVFLIIASRNPLKHLSLIWFTIWSSLVHGGIMAAQSFAQLANRGHLLGDVPALLGVAVALAALTPRGEGARASRGSRMRP